MIGRDLLTFVERDPDADVLVVTNMWPEPTRPVYGIFVERQVRSLQAAGVRCDVLYLRGYASPLAYPLAAVRLAVSSLDWRGRYRLVHVHAGETALAARFHVGTPMVVSYCGDDVLGDRRADGAAPLSARVRAHVVREHARLFTATIVKSRVMATALPAGVRVRTEVIPNGVDAALFQPMARAEARAALGWDDDERVALFAATKPESPAKRLQLARDACERARRVLGRVRLHVAAGEAPERMPLLMNASDCLLVTSAVEGSPNTVKEALMCNLPVVSTPVGDVEERLEAVTPSYVCPPSAEALGEALVRCLHERRRSNGREVAAELAQEEIAQRVIALYDAVGRPRRTPARRGERPREGST